jgi:hypothetical protein
VCSINSFKTKTSAKERYRLAEVTDATMHLYAASSLRVFALKMVACSLCQQAQLQFSNCIHFKLYHQILIMAAL